MNSLDDFKAIWKSQKETEPGGEEAVGVRLDRYRKRIRRTNMIASACMIGTSVYLVFLMMGYPDEKPLFYLSIMAIILIMAIMLVILWRRTLISADKISLDSRSYVIYKLKRLKRNKLIVQFSPVYGLLLGILINAYAYSLLEHASMEFVFWVTNINWIYIFLISYLSYAYKMRKYRKYVEPLVHDLEKLKARLELAG